MSVVTSAGSNSCSGAYSIPAGQAILVRKDALSSTGIIGSIAGTDYFKGTMRTQSAFDVALTQIQTQDPSCAYVLAWTSGMGSFKSSGSSKQLTLDLLGTVDAFCSPNPDKHCTAQLHIEAQ